MTKTYKGIYKAVIAVGNSLEERVPDRKGIGQRDYLVTNFGLKIDELTISKLWMVEIEEKKGRQGAEKAADAFFEISKDILVNPVVHSYVIYDGFHHNPFEEKAFDREFFDTHLCDWILRFAFKTNPFVSDVEGDSVRQAIKDVLGIKLSSLRAATQYTIKGKLSAGDLELIANQSPIDSKCHKIVYFPIKIDDMEGMQSPIGKDYSQTFIIGH